MSDKTPHYEWEIPVRGSKPWYDGFLALQTQIDATVFGLKDAYFPLAGGEFSGDISLGGHRLYDASKIGIGVYDADDIKGSLHIKASGDQLLIEDPNAGVDEKKWMIKTLNGDFELIAANDLWDFWSAAIMIKRSGATPQAVNINTKLGIGTSNPDGRFEISGPAGPKMIILPSNRPNAQCGISSRDVPDESIIQIGTNLNSNYIGSVDTTKCGAMMRFDTRNQADRYTAVQIHTRKAGIAEPNYTIPFKIRAGCPDDTIFMEENGYIGLHTRTPQYPLDHNGIARFTDEIRANGGIFIDKSYDQIIIKDSDAGINEKIWITKGNNGVWEIMTADDSYTEWHSALKLLRDGSMPKAVVIPEAKLGIESDNPLAKLDIGGSIGPKQLKLPVNNANIYAGIGTLDAADNGVMGIGLNCSFIGDIIMTKPGAGILFDTRDNTDNTLFRIVTKGNNDLYTYPFKLKSGCPDDTMFLASDGKIGLHTNIPEYSLDQTGDTRIKGSLRISKSSDHIIFDQVSGVDDEKLWVMKSSDGVFQFVTANDAWTQWNEIFKITRNGINPTSFIINSAKVGIGLAEPIYIFDVTGDSRIAGSLLINDPILANHAATKGYVDQQVNGVYYVGYTAPETVFVGKLWAKLGEPAETALRMYWEDGFWHAFFMGGIVE